MIFRLFFISVVKLYQFLSPTLHALSHMIGLPFQCKYPVSCSEFAIDKLRNEKKLSQAMTHIVRRLLSCGPWTNHMSKTKTGSFS